MEQAVFFRTKTLIFLLIMLVWTTTNFVLCRHIIAFSPSGTFPFVPSQVIRIGPDDPDYCYKNEHIKPNLQLRRKTHIWGAVTDKFGTPFKHSQIEIRKYISQKKQTKIIAVSTDEVGRFDLGTIKPGSYRLLPSATRAFRQSEDLQCATAKCELKIELVINATDQPLSVCPIR